MTTFLNIWNTETKQLAEECINEPRLVQLMNKSEGYQPTQEEQEYLKSVSEKYKDIPGMYYISNMIWKVEHALTDGRRASAMLGIAEVYQVLNRPSYFQNVFNGDENNEEWKSRAALRDSLSKLLKL